MLRGSILAGAVALAAFCGAPNAKTQGVFTLSSPSFKDGERLAVKNAGNNKANPNCVGENISPALNWANPPEGTKSYALLMFDPEGRPPGGVSHWVAYGIPVAVTGFAEGEVSKTGDKYSISIVSRSRAMSAPVAIGVNRGPSPVSKLTSWPKASGTNRISLNRIAASNPKRRIGCNVASTASFGL